MILTDLNADVLLMIFERCTVEDALRLFHVCRKFQAIIRCHTFQQKSLDLLLVGHRNREAIAFQR